VSIQDVADIMDTVDGGVSSTLVPQRIVHQQQPGLHWESSWLLDTASFFITMRRPVKISERLWRGSYVLSLWFQYGVNTQFSFDTLKISRIPPTVVPDGAGANSQQDFSRQYVCQDCRAPLPRPSITKRLPKGACRIVPHSTQTCRSTLCRRLWNRGDVPQTVQDHNRNLIAANVNANRERLEII
jgi:hypothetical protein